MEKDGFDHNNLLGQSSQIYDDESDHKEVNENIGNSKICLDTSPWVYVALINHMIPVLHSFQMLSLIVELTLLMLTTDN